MEKINETITVAPNEGLEIDISRIVYNEGTEATGTATRPHWLKANFTADELNAQFPTLTFTEDDLEQYLKQWLEYTVNCGVASFRWMWDKYRNYKAA